MNKPCTCATATLTFLAGSDVAQDVISNIPPVMMRRQVPAEVMALDREKMVDQLLGWMVAGASEIKKACGVDTDSTVRNLQLAREQLSDLDDEKLKALIIQSYNDVHLDLVDCALIEMSVSREIPLPEQEAALQRLGVWRLVKKSDDGNVTVETKQGRYIVTTEGLVFKEEAQGG